MIDRAILFAAAAHKNMFRKGSGSQPYIFHPLEVLSLVSLMTEDEDILCAAVLHDTAEDTGTTLEEIRSEFGERVAALVAYESEDKRKGRNKGETWLLRKQETISRFLAIDDIGAKMVCLADKVSNLRSIHLGLLDRGEEFWEVFNQKDPKMHYWYFNELKKALADLSEYSVYKEYYFLIDTIFGPYIEE